MAKFECFHVNQLLIEAVLTGQERSIPELLYHGANPNLVINDGNYTLLHYAAKKGDVNMMALLILGGADINSAADYSNLNFDQDSKMNLFASGYRKFTPLHEAVLHKNQRAVEVLLRFGANSNASTEGGITPAHIAVETEHAQILRYLLIRADVNAAVTARPYSGWTPLHLAVVKGNLNVIDILLENEADVCAKDDAGFIPFQYTSSYEIFEFILGHYRFCNDHDSLARAIMIRGVDVNSQRTPVHKCLLLMALEFGFEDFARALQDYEVRNEIGKSFEWDWAFLHRAFAEKMAL